MLSFAMGVLLVHAAAAQTLVLKDGRTIVSEAGAPLRCAGSTVMVKQQIGGATGEIGFAFSAIEKIDFPAPPELASAVGLLRKGQAAGALARIEGTVAFHTPFRSVPGNWWAPAALLKADALLALDRGAEADSLLGEVARDATRPDQALVAQALLAGRSGQPARAIEIYDRILSNGSDPSTLAQVWFLKAEGHRALREFEPAVFAYLEIPVFYPDEKSLLPQAALGCARAMAGLDAIDEAKKRFEDLIKTFPDSPEAAAARGELEKLNAKKS